MATRRVRLVADSERLASARSASGDGVDPADLHAAFVDIRSELKVPAGFPPEVVERARLSAASPRLPGRDETDLPFFTIDPPGSMDLDQAMHLQRDGDGYRVRYAIADLPAVVEAGDLVDAESWRRGQTIYAPDGRTPLHPAPLSEDAASLLPGRTRSAYVWDLRLDPSGDVTGTDLYRARVRSTDRLDYATVQQEVDAGVADERLVLLEEIGVRRIALEQQRGGASLPMPEQEVVLGDTGLFQLHFRPPLAAEDWNAQISLMTGMAAATLMLRAKVGILRTMPAPEDSAVRRLRQQARGLGVDWPDALRYGEWLRTLDRENSRHLALIHEATSLFRGAGYTPFDGQPPEQQLHAAVAAPYAHVTAPLRRLVDRFGLAVCEAVCRGADVPEWVRDGLPRLPEVMRRSDSMASAVERACTDVVEAAALHPRVGETFAAYVVDVRRDDLLLQVAEPAVLARARGTARAGDSVSARLVEADVATRTVRFELV